jgi:tetratricopeptide (TPR) repeat protein
MLQLLPLPRDLPPRTEADFCLALARLNEGAGREDHWQAAQRAETLFRQLGDSERLGDALLLVATIGTDLHRMAEAVRALHAAEALVTADTPLRKQAALAATQGGCHLRLGAPERAVLAFRHQADLYRRAGAEIGEYLALGNVGSAQLEAGDLDAAIQSLRKSVDGLRRLKSPYGQETRLGKLALALALREDDVDVLPLAREAFDRLRSPGLTFGPLMAAALHHVRSGDLQRGVLIAGFAGNTLARSGQHPCAIDLHLQQRVHACAAASHPDATIESWLRSGTCLTEAQAAAIAFDNAPLHGPA